MSEVAPIAVRGGSFTIVANGFADGPAQALQRYLVEHDAREVRTVAHPLVPEGGTAHRIATTRAGATTTRTFDPHLRPPLSFALDPLVPLRSHRCDAWFGFNCLATARALAERAARRTRRIVHWSVDFVPERFGPGVLTKVYETIDARCCRSADFRVDLSEAALHGREQHYGLDVASAATPVVVPMGAWLRETPQVPDDAIDARRVVFLGHLVPRMGVEILVDALAALRDRDVDVRADIVGGGPLLDEVRARVTAARLDDRVVVHGFVADHREVERILATGSVAVAPYVRDPSSFTRFADPGKLKAYLGAALPILLTDVPPNAAELAQHGGAEILADDAADLASAIARLLDAPDEWRRRHELARAHAQAFDWDAVLGRALAAMGFVVG